MNKTTTPALISIAYSLRTEQTAEVQLRNNNGADTYLTILHEASTEAIIHDIPGNHATSVFSVDDQETLTVLVRLQGTVIACAVFEASIASVETIGALLITRAASNVIIEQSETTVFAEDFPRNALIDRIARSLTTIERIDPSELMEVR